MNPPTSFKATVYATLEVAMPDNRVSRLLQRCTLLLVGLNTIALLLSLIDAIDLVHPVLVPLIEQVKSNRLYAFWVVETLSTAFFAVEYILRLWSAPASQRFRGRWRFGLRPLLLIDLASILPFLMILFLPSRALVLCVLQIGWGIRHLKSLRCFRQLPVVEASVDELLQQIDARLADVRQQVAHGREADLARVTHHLDSVSQQYAATLGGRRDRQGLEAQPRRQPPFRQGGLLGSGVAAVALPFLAGLDQLETALIDPGTMQELSVLITSAYDQSARVFDAVPRRVTVEVALAAEAAVGKKTVRLRRIGRRHWQPMMTRYAAVFGKRHQLYAADVQRDLSRIRTAMTTAVEMSGSKEGEVGLNRAISQLRNLDGPVRLAWDDLLFQLEDEHQKRLQWVRTDIERSGSMWFYLGSVWRWVLNRLSRLQQGLKIIPWLWNRLQQHRRDLTAFFARLLRPLLAWMGLLKPPALELLRALDESRLDSVLERGLPTEYTDHFAFVPLREDGVFLGLDEEFANINIAIERWQLNNQSSFIIYGHQGTGKSTLLNMAQERLFTTHAVIHDTMTQKLTTIDALLAYLKQLFDCPAAERFEDLAKSLLAAPARAVLLENCHHLFFRSIGGLEAIRYLLWLIANTNHHVLWGLSLDQEGYKFLNQVMPLSALFHVQVHLHARNGEELRRLIMLRHNRTNVSLNYIQDKRNEKALQRQIKGLQQHRRSGRINLQEALELTFFDALAAACAGNITVAQFYWLRSLRMHDVDRYEVQPFDVLDLSLIWELSQDQAFILVAVLQHGQLTAVELARILDVDDIDMRLELEILSNYNILQLDFKAYTFGVNPIVLKMVCEMLESRNLLYS